MQFRKGELLANLVFKITAIQRNLYINYADLKGTLEEEHHRSNLMD